MIQVIIPMAGEGRRFAEAGYTEPKPLIDVCGKPMIERVMDSLTPTDGAEFTLITRGVFPGVDLLGPNTVLYLTHSTEGAVDTLMHAMAATEPGEVLVANCDQWIAPGVMDQFLAFARDHAAAVMIFNSTNPHHSYVRLDGYTVTEVVEKQVISDDAVLGVYYFADSRTLFDYGRKVIANNLRAGANEFYVSSILDLYVKDGGELVAFEVDVHEKAMLGTPEELRIFEQKVKSGRIQL